ncbi:DUF3293 domain-containing protein [Mycolicibacterium goodii]|uniref:DUF3293 domain-containing protein n=1 Tax=Mycolicibacterium goodii TaxID=134601 RepID=UPI001BDC6B24|nr:DUF3293 domain-containing protein [Mycolicibacterium goodii]MBU8817850.1 DUF3293 domain-containing protein [Mycolicibacterium goodii]
MRAYEDFEWTGVKELARLAGSETPWRYYEQTAVHLELPDGGGRVVPVGGVGDERPPLGALHIITAIQPETDSASADNAARLAVLDQELSAEGIWSLRAVGASLDGGHAEESRAVSGLSDDQARRLGLRFGQVAVFAWSGPRWSLLACATSRVTHRGWRWLAEKG